MEIVGRTELIVDAAPSDGAQVGPAAPAGHTGSLVFSCRNPGHEAKADRELLRAFLDHVALAAAGFSHGAHAALLAVADGQGAGRAAQLERRRLAPLEPRARGNI